MTYTDEEIDILFDVLWDHLYISEITECINCLRKGQIRELDSTYAWTGCYRYFTMAFDEVPLYINHPVMWYRLIVEWRLKIGR